MLTLLLALALQDLPTDKDADAAVKKLKETVADGNATDTAKIDAIKEALQVKHETVVKAVAAIVAGENERVAVGGTLALGDVDHPVAVDVLVRQLPARAKQGPILAATCRALGTLGWQRAAAALADIVKRVGDKDVRPVVPEALDALGRLGAASSVDPIFDLLNKLGKTTWENQDQLRRSAFGALAAITGGSAERIEDWETFWKENRARLLASAKSTWWLKPTHARTTTSPGEKPPADALLVAVRITEESAPIAPPPKKK